MPDVTTPPETSSDTATGRQRETGGLAGLSRMSTTAGLGLQEYRAINPWAVTAVVAGLASWIALLTLLLLVVPAIAVVCGTVGLVQIRRSHGTQSGTALALAGIVLGLVAGGFVGLAGLQEHRQQRAYAAEIRQVIETFGDRLSAADFAGAYALTDGRFQERVPLAEFRGMFENFARRRTDDGRIVSILPTGASTNDRAQVAIDPATDIALAKAMLILHFPGATGRQAITLVRTRGGWRITGFGDWFETQ